MFSFQKDSKVDARFKKNNRDVTLVPTPAKVTSSCVRKAVLGAAVACAPAGAVGSGLRGGSTAHARVAVRAVAGLGRKFGKSVGQVFVDVKSAFAAMVRAAVFKGCAARDVFCAILKDLGFEGSELIRLVEEGTGYSEFERACGEHSYRLLSELHRGTWSAFEYTEGVIQTGNGTLAGTSVADIVFSLVTFKIMHKRCQQIFSDF